MAELDEVADMSLVQPYVVNHERVVYLNPRSQAPQHAVKCFRPASECLVCDRKLVKPIFRFCSISCKVYAPTTASLMHAFLASMYIHCAGDMSIDRIDWKAGLDYTLP